MIRNSALAAVVGIAAGAAGALSAPDARANEEGGASWYALNSKTANGERMDPSALTAAHPSLPFGTRVRVKNLSNKRSVIVRINDRGPFTRGRVIDVSRAAAAELGFLRAGVTRVRVTPIDTEEASPSPRETPTEPTVLRAGAGGGGPALGAFWPDGWPHFGSR